MKLSTLQLHSTFNSKLSTIKTFLFLRLDNFFMPFFLIKSKKEFTFLKKVLHFAQKCIIFARHFSGNDLTPWGVLQVAVRRVIRHVHRRIRTGRDIYRTGCFLFSVSVRVAECHHRCTTFAATWRCGTARRKQTNRTQTASDLWRIGCGL